MGKAIDLVQAATKDTQSIASAGMSLKSQHSELSAANIESESAQTTTTQRCPIQISVQNKNASSEVMPALDPSKNEQLETSKSQSQRENGTQARAAGVGTNPKKTRQRLRKGKWTIEEEEYTSRIIQYFSTGLLTLPDGATLRSYLAEKLNCDPMRITKKFTGACCLGRRAYHLRDRPRASPAEIEMASLELLHLEQRFRLRVEHEQTGLPLPPRHELLASQPTPTAAVAPSLFTLQQGAHVIKATNHWMQNPVIAPSPGHPSLLPGLAGIIPHSSVSSANANLSLHNSSLLLAAGQLLLQNSSERTRANNSAAVAAPPPLQMLNNLVTSYALSRAITQQQAGMSVLQPSGSSTSPISGAAPKITSLSSAPSSTIFNVNVPDIATSANKEQPQTSVVGFQGQHFQNMQSFQQQQHDIINSSASTSRLSRKEEHTKKLKAAFEEQQRALRMAYEKSLQDAQEREEKSFDLEIPNASSDLKGSKPTTIASTTSNNSKSTLNTVSPAEQLQRSYEAHLASLQRAEQQSSLKTSSKLSPPSLSKSEPASGAEVEGNKTKSTKTEGGRKSSQKKTQDEEAGAILLGFLNSLRESFEDAVEAKDGEKETKERSGDITRYRKVPRGGPNTETVPSVQLESSTVMTEVSSDSSSHVIERRNGNANDHSKPSIKSRRQDSDPITSLSHFQSSKRKVKPASVTETSSSTSSQPTIEQPSSSQEDSKSDKMGHSSSEESDKEIVASRRISKGPPRKRLKNFHEPHEFTRENLMAHSKRMDMECGQSGDASSSDE